MVVDPVTKQLRDREFSEYAGSWKQKSPLELAEKRSSSAMTALLRSNQDRKKLKEDYKTSVEVINGLTKMMETGQKLRQKFKQEAESAKAQLQNQLSGQIIALNEKILDLQAALGCLQQMGKEVANAVIEFGDHKVECNVVDLRSSGRLVKIDEQDMCTCGWTEFYTRLFQAREYVHTGQLTDDDIKQVLREFKQNNAQVV